MKIRKKHCKTLMADIQRLGALFLFVLFTTGFSVAQPDGAKLFKANCASCHKPHKRMTGPALKGALDRVPSKEWLVKWVKNSQKLVKAGDPYAVQIFEEYSKSVMTPQALSEEEIWAVMDYVEAYQPPVKKATKAEEGVGATGTEEGHTPWLMILAIIFLIVIGVLSGVRRSLMSLVSERNGETYTGEHGYIDEIRAWMRKNKRFVTLIAVVLIVMGSVDGWYALKGVGVYDGYAPEQPIKFSHKVHAGENKINCVYCHHSAEKGKTAGIPSVNVCMNCHKGISEGSETGTVEIAKIYEAAGWDPELQQYTKPQKPIKWVRIHNLPDFAYFNHSQHVVVGKQECQTCHGPVEETGYPMKQHAELTMGWCIDCHRETNVAMEGNAYYEKMHAELVEQHKEEGITTFKVKDIGGLECAKCHY